MGSRTIPGCAALAMALAAGSAGAANAPFQGFFFSVCGSAGGALATRCDETPDSLGNLSGDSESSLNPSQALGHNRSLVDAAQSRGDALRDDAPAPGSARVEMGPFALLLNVYGSWFQRDPGATVVAERGLDGDSTGAEIGFDYRASDRVVLGALLGIERSDYDFDAEDPGTNFVPQSRAGDGEVDDVYLTVFGSFALGAAGFLDLSGGFGQADGTYQRYSVFQESTRTLPQVNTEVSGNTDGALTWFGVNAGYDFTWDAVGLGIYGGATYTRSELDGYSERDLNGSGLAMRFGDNERTSLLGHAGLRAGYTISGSAGVFVPQLRIEYQHEFDDDPQTVTSSFLLDPAGTTFTLTGDAPDESGVEAALSLYAILPSGWNAFVDYSVLFSSDDLDRRRLTLGLRKEF